MSRRGVAARVDHPIIDFHVHVHGEEPMAHFPGGHPFYTATAALANLVEPVLYKIVQQIAYHGRHPRLVRMMDRFSHLGMNEIQRLFNKHGARELIASMDRNGIERAVILAIEPFLKAQEIFQVIANHPGRFVVFGSLKLDDPLGMEHLRGWLEEGRIIGLKLHPLQNMPWQGEQILALCELADSFGVPVLFHTGTFPFHWKEHEDRNFDERVESIEGVMVRFPNLRVILGHTGWDQWRTAMELGRKYPNVILEASWQPERVIRAAIETVGVDRVLFGSDFPLFNQADALNTMYHALTRDKFRMVTYENPRRVIEEAEQALARRRPKAG